MPVRITPIKGYTTRNLAELKRETHRLNLCLQYDQRFVGTVLTVQNAFEDGNGKI